MTRKELEERRRLNAFVADLQRKAAMKNVKPVEELNAPLWRYTDVSRFLAMLATDELPLIRVDKLGDEYEGFAPHLPEQAYRGTIFADKNLQNDRSIRNVAENARKYFYASCWHGNDEESDAMWKVYVKGEGLAIRTTYGSLISSLRDANDDFVIGKVRYGEMAPGDSMLQVCMTKRPPFKHEQEVRVIWHDDHSERSETSGDTLPIRKGLACDLGKLIERVYIGPPANQWFKDAINDLLKKYGRAKIHVMPSDLSPKPAWASKTS